VSGLSAGPGTAPDGEPDDGRPTVAVFKFASCDGCQLSLLDCEEEFLTLAGRVRFRHFLEAGPDDGGRGPYDVALVEGSITTAADRDRIREVRRRSRVLVTIGACATSGGIQALRNLADVEDYTRLVYARPEYVETLATSTAIADHVPVDVELRGCPVDRHQLLEVLNALANGRRPAVTPHSVCLDCKLSGRVCVMVAHGTPCLGPITHTGCGALCPGVHRGCYGCFGPAEDPNVAALEAPLRWSGMGRDEVVLALRTFNADRDPFRSASAALAGTTDDTDPREER
jgi:coenzyme F420-reducing hydrogenase gamma subunit